MDVHISGLPGREAAVRHGGAARIAHQGALVAVEQRYRRGLLAPQPQHAARGAESTPPRLGEPGPCARAVEEGREAGESELHDELRTAVVFDPFSPPPPLLHSMGLLHSKD